MSRTTTSETSEDELLLKALGTWGFESQRLIWLEELAELSKVLAKFGRVINSSTTEEIAEEIADVDICLSQMKLLFTGWAEIREKKLARLRQYISLDSKKEELA